MKTIKFFLAAVLLALLVNSCNNPFNMADTPQPNPLPAGKGSLSLKIAGPSGRTIMPVAFASEDLYYELIFTRTGGSPATTVTGNYEDIENPITLNVGTYSLVVNAYAGEEGQLLFSGTADGIKIEEGDGNEAFITLLPVLEGGTGTFSWDITLPESAVSAYMDIVPRGSATQEERITLNNSEKTGTRPLNSGVYDVIITMKGHNDEAPDVELTVTRKEILHIYKGRVSLYEKSFAEINFNFVYEVKFIFDNGEDDLVHVVHGDTIGDYFGEDYLAEYKPSLDNDAYLYSGDSAPTEPYTFDGWYLDEGFASKWEENDPVIGNIDLYPKWNDPIYFGFGNIVNYINESNTSGNYTLFIAEDVTLEESLTINSNVTLTVTSANVNMPSTINRGTSQLGANSGLFVVQGGLTLQNITIDGQRTSYSTNEASLVRIDGGIFTMNNGAVLRNNIARIGGSGVVVNTGTFNMTGGTITGNSVTSTTDGAGGGVVVGSGQFTMTGGTIGGINSGEGNTATTGGGVMVGNGTFTMTGGIITGNTATSSSGGGGGVFNSGTLVLGGNAVIKGNYNGNGSNKSNNNVYLSNDKYITLGTTPLQSTAEIWVQTISTHNVIVQSGATSDDAQYFWSDDENKVVAFAGSNGNNGQLVLKNVTTTGLSFESIGSPATAYRVRKSETYGSTLPAELVIPAYYRPSNSDPYLPVTEIGSADDADWSSGAFNSCEDLTSVIIPASVTSIGGDAFWGCRALTSITIPPNVTYIGEGAFQSCNGLTINSITIPAGVIFIGNGAFSDTRLSITVSPDNLDYASKDGILFNKEMTQLIAYPSASGPVDIPYGIKEIGRADATSYKGAFFNCPITSITIPASVTSIGGLAFEQCSNLTSITIPATVTSIGVGAFTNCGLQTVVFGSGSSLKTIGGHAFYQCGALTEIDIPLSVTSIGEFAFYGCGRLTDITIPEGVTSIGDYAFAYSGLTSITIPPRVTSIGESAFAGTTGLTEITIPASVTSIGESAFNVCSSLTSITVSSDNLSYASEGGILYNKEKTVFVHVPQAISEVTIPKGVETIGDSAFGERASLTSITISATVTSIGVWTFFACSSLTSITIPATVESIGESAFAYSGLTSVIFEGNDTSIADANSFPDGSTLMAAYNDSSTGGAGTYILMNGTWTKTP